MMSTVAFLLLSLTWCLAAPTVDALIPVRTVDAFPSILDDGTTVTIFGPPSLSVEDEQEFGSVVDFNQNGDILAIGAPGYGSAKQGSVFIYDAASYQLLWSVMGDTVNEVVGGHVSLSIDKIAIGRRNSIEIYDAYTGELIGEPIRSQQGTRVTLVNDELLIIGEDRFNTRTGQARILSYNHESGVWDDVITVPGLFPQGRFGWIVSASADGSRVAISAPNAEQDSYRQGYVAIFERNDTDGSWAQLGNILFGTAESGQFGFSLAMSGDGNTVVAGYQGTTDGAVAAFRFSEGAWQQVGTTISSKEAGQRFGRSVAISHDGTRLAGTSILFDNERGHVRVFDLVDNDWSSVHEVEGDNTMDRLGSGIHGVHLSSDGSVLTVGAVWATTSGGDRTGEVKVVTLKALVEESSTLVPSSSPTTGITGPQNALSTPVPTLSSTESPTAAPTTMASMLPSDLPTASPSTEPSGSESLAPSSLRGSSISLEVPSNEPSSSKAPSGENGIDVVVVRGKNLDGLSSTASMPSVTTTTLLGISTIVLCLLL